MCAGKPFCLQPARFWGNRHVWANSSQLPAQPAVPRWLSTSLTPHILAFNLICLPPIRRQQLFSRLMQQEVSFFDAQDAGQLTSRLGADCSVIARLFATNINVALRNTLQVRFLDFSA